MFITTVCGLNLGLAQLPRMAFSTYKLASKSHPDVVTQDDFFKVDIFLFCSSVPSQISPLGLGIERYSGKTT